MYSFILAIYLTLFISTYGQSQPSNYVFAFLSANPERETLSTEDELKLQKSHLENSDKLFKEGKILASGPFESGGGFFVISARNVEQARTILATDPAIKANRWHVALFLFQPVVGNICAVTEPYDMATYSFVRYEESNAVANYKAGEGLDNGGSTDFILRVKQFGDLILAGTFANNEGGVLIYSGGSQHNMLRDDPAVTSGYLSIHTKQLFIAKGSFCEE